MPYVSNLWIEGYVFALSDEKYFYLTAQKCYYMPGIKISKRKISDIINRKE